MILKVCGLTDNTSSREVATMPAVDYVGFIFYEGSKRFTTSSFSTDKKKVGVFVNAPLGYIKQQIEMHGLNAVQLHGSDTPEFVEQLPQDITIIKAFGIANQDDLKATEAYGGLVNYFLFDTKSIHHGGTGMAFNWDILNAYKGNTPFLLSGGIGLESVEKLKAFRHAKLAGYDVNSCFESAPMVKDTALLTQFIKDMKL